jgi:copper chaperone
MARFIIGACLIWNRSLAMITFRVDDMTCGHCVSAITKAVKEADAGAQVQVDLARHLVQVEPSTANAEDIGSAIEEAGYTPEALPAQA